MYLTINYLGVDCNIGCYLDEWYWSTDIDGVNRAGENFNDCKERAFNEVRECLIDLYGSELGLVVERSEAYFKKYTDF